MFSTEYKGYKIEIADDGMFKEGSSDNITSYDLIYRDISDSHNEATSKHGIKVYKEGFYKSAILLATGGATGVWAGSAIIDNGNLITRCCNVLFSLRLPGLELNWKTEVDTGTCFSIHQYKDSYISHGELSIARITREGQVLWEVSARDIFVEPPGSTEDAFRMHPDYIELTDWAGYKYRLDYGGNISDLNIPYK